MTNQDMLPWFEALTTAPFIWHELGSAGGIRARVQLRDSEGSIIEYLNLVTACAAMRGRAFHSGDYKDAAMSLNMPYIVANALIRAGDNNLPESHKFFVPLAKLVEFLTNGGNV